MDGFIDFMRGKEEEKMPVQLVQRGLHHQLKDKPRCSKAFQYEGPAVPGQTSPIDDFENLLENFFPGQTLPIDDFENQFEIFEKLFDKSGTQPEESFVKGCVKYSKCDALKNMVSELNTLDSRTHGCIVNKNFQPYGDDYVKDTHFYVDQKLGKGSYGKVDLCHDSISRMPFVRKKSLKGTLRTSEILVPVNLNHRNIVKLYGLIQRGTAGGTTKMELLLEYGGIALNHFLLDNTLDDSEIWELTEQGLSGLQQLEYFGMVHLDMKPENICITKNSDNLMLKITDFGSAKLPTDPISFCGWTPEYMAPESCKFFLQCTQPGLNFGVIEDSITDKVDVFGFGLVVMYLYRRYHILQRVLTNGKKSYAGIDPVSLKDLQFELVNSLATIEDLAQVLIPDECDLDMRELLKQMTTHDYSGRPGAEQCLQVVKERKRKQKMRQKQEVYTSHSVSKLPEITLPIFIPVDDKSNPESAINYMEIERGHVRNTKDKLRQKIEKGPYSQIERGHVRSTTKDKRRQKLEKGPYSQIERGHVRNTTKVRLRQKLEKGSYSQKSGKGSKTAHKTVPPQTPVEEMRKLSHSFPSNGKANVQKAEKACQVVTQATQEAGDFVATNGSSAVQMETTLPRTFPSIAHQSVYHTARKRGPNQASDKTSGVPKLVYDEPRRSSYSKSNKKWTCSQECSMSEEEGYVASLVTQNAENSKKMEILRQLAGLLKMQNISFGNTDRTVMRMPMDIIPQEVETDHMSTEQSTGIPAEDWDIHRSEVGQGNIQNFNFLS